MKKHSFYRLALPATVFALAMGGATGCNSASAAEQESGESAAPQQALTLVGADVAKEVDHNPVHRYRGRIFSPETVAIVPQVSGTILKVPFEEGSMVKEGQLLYQIDDVKYVAAVEAAKAQIAQCEATLAYARKTAERTQTLFDRKVASADALDSAVSARDSAEAALASAKAALISAEDDLKHTKIIAPIDGKAGLNDFSVGNYVTPSSGALTTVIRQNPLRLAFSLSNRDFLRFFGGEKTLREQFSVRLVLADGSAYEPEGRIEFVDNTANARTDTLTVYVRFPNPEGVLIPGSTVSVNVFAKEAAKKVAVPLTAIVHDDKGSYVWVLDSADIPSRRDIVPGTMTEQIGLVESGLAAGERVVSLGTHKVVPGVPVRLNATR